MTQVSVAPTPMSGISPAQAAAPGAAAEAALGSEAGVDFAAILMAQIAQPAKDAPGTEILAALLPSPAPDAAEATEVLPAAPDLSALLPPLAGLMPPPATAIPTDPAPQAAGSAAAAPLLRAAVTNAAPGPAQSALPALAGGAAAAAVDAAPAAPAAPTQPAPPPAALATRPMPAEAAAATLAADPRMPAASEHADPNAAAQAAAPLAHAAPAGDAPSVVRVDTPVGNRGWDAEVGQKIVLLVNRQESRAELTLTPPQLGKVEVTISFNGDQTSAAFVSASPAAREALEQALPRLREILAEAGITLGQASVNAESARRDRDEPAADGHGGGRGPIAAGGADAPAPWLRRSNGLIDTFA